jgi:hypothetical protein
LYLRAQRQLEEEVKNVGFRNTVIVQPDFADSWRPSLAKRVLGRLLRSNRRRIWPTFSLAQDAEVIAKAAVSAAFQCACLKGIMPGFWILNGADIVHLGETEWKVPEVSRPGTDDLSELE